MAETSTPSPMEKSSSLQATPPQTKATIPQDSAPQVKYQMCGLTMGPVEWGLVIGIILVLFPKLLWIIMKLVYTFIKIIS